MFFIGVIDNRRIESQFTKKGVVLKILIVNVHSGVNLGDDGIMDATLRGVRQVHPEAEVTVAANDPDSWCKYEDITIVGSLLTWVVDLSQGYWDFQPSRLRRMKISALQLPFAALLFRLFKTRFYWGTQEKKRLLAAYYNADLVLSFGGGYFYAYERRHASFLWKLLSIAFAQWLGKRVVMLPQSIGPVHSRFHRWIARLVFNRVDVIMLRERKSLAFIQDLNIQRQQVVLADVAFNLPHVPSLSKGYLFDAESNRNNTPKLRIGVTFMNFEAQHPGFKEQLAYESAYRQALERLNQELGAEIYVFIQSVGPTIDQDDRTVSDHMIQQLDGLVPPVKVLQGFAGALEIKAAFAQMDCIVGTRMHSGIFALSCGVPTVLITYMPKGQGTMELLGLEQYTIPIGAVTADGLYELVCRAICDNDVIREGVKERLPVLQSRLAVWTTYLNIDQD